MTILSLGASLLLGLLQTATPAATPTNSTPSPQIATPAALADSLTASDPKELLDLGRRINGLTGPNVPPWHLRATFELFNDDETSKEKGTFEEWWVSDKQYKRSYQSAGFSQVEYGTEKGPLRTGDPKWPSGPVASIRRLIVQPLPGEEETNYVDSQISEHTLAGTKLRCIEMTSRFPPPGNTTSPVVASYCFNSEKPVLRTASTSTQALFNRALYFNQHYLGGDIEVVRSGKDDLKLHLELIEPLNRAPADFQPPPDAVAAPARIIDVAGGILAGHILTKATPEYPASALANHIQGTVILQGIISKNGRVTELHPLAGPPVLQGAAIDAVRRWVYKPYLLNGEPVDVRTTINVVFAISQH